MNGNLKEAFLKPFVTGTKFLSLNFNLKITSSVSSTIVNLLNFKTCQFWDLFCEDKVGHWADAGDDDHLAQEEKEGDDLVEDDHAHDVAHQPDKKCNVIVS